MPYKANDFWYEVRLIKDALNTGTLELPAGRPNVIAHIKDLLRRLPDSLGRNLINFEESKWVREDLEKLLYQASELEKN